MLRRTFPHLFFLLPKSSSVHLHNLSSNPNSLPSTHRPFSTASPSPPTTDIGELSNLPHLTPDELKQINHLIPHLCSSNHLHEAIRLIDTALLTNPPLQSLPLPLLIDRLSSEPDMTQSMSLLNRLKHNPNSHPSHLLHINRLLLVSYLKKHKPKEAIKILNWISRPDSPCAPDETMFGVTVKGLCRNFMTFDALMVVKGMVERNLKKIGGSCLGFDDVRDCVCRSLLSEARVREAQELNQAFVKCASSDGGEDQEHLRLLLDRIIANWTD